MRRGYNQLQALFFSLFFAASAFAETLATLDWTVAETLVALGKPPRAVGDKTGYGVWVGEPSLSAETLDLGVRLQPNPEQILALSQMQSIQFINSGFYAQTTPMLEKFATVHQVDFYQAGEAWQHILQATRQIAMLVGKTEEAEQLIGSFSQKIAELRPLVAPFHGRPIALVQFADSRHLRIYGRNSAFGEVLHQLGFQNAWTGAVNVWGFEHIEVTQLAGLAENSRLVVVKPYPSNVVTALKYNTLWQKLNLAQDPLILPPVWTFGALPSAIRFAQVFGQALQSGGERW